MRGKPTTASDAVGSIGEGPLGSDAPLGHGDSFCFLLLDDDKLFRHVKALVRRPAKLREQTCEFGICFIVNCC